MEDLKELVLGWAPADAIARLVGLVLIVVVGVAIVWATVHVRAPHLPTSVAVPAPSLTAEGELAP